MRFFVWRQNGRIVAFALCMIEGDAIYGNTSGSTTRSRSSFTSTIMYSATWRPGRSPTEFKSLGTGGLNYDPKLHLKCRLDPLDLYVKHTSPFFNAL